MPMYLAKFCFWVGTYDLEVVCDLAHKGRDLLHQPFDAGLGASLELRHTTR